MSNRLKGLFIGLNHIALDVPNKKIYYTKKLSDDFGSIDSTIYVMNLDGTGETKISTSLPVLDIALGYVSP